MNPFAFAQAADPASACATLRANANARYIAGGTNLLDLMKDEVEQPTLLLDLKHLPLGGIERTALGMRVGALATMADVADDARLQQSFPGVVQALLAGASPQLRNMATIGGNLMQRTRCAYFRDVSQACNKRRPGDGCAAIAGENRAHAVIGGSQHCICTHPSDLAVALLSVDAIVRVRRATGLGSLQLADLHLLPGTTPQRETVLEHGDLIEAVELTDSPLARNSTYLKVRDRASYEFALVSAAVAYETRAGLIHTARVALGGVAPKAWRSNAAETALIGKPATSATFAAAGVAATTGMRGYGKNDFKIALTQRTVQRALERLGGNA